MKDKTVYFAVDAAPAATTAYYDAVVTARLAERLVQLAPDDTTIRLLAGIVLEQARKTSRRCADTVVKLPPVPFPCGPNQHDCSNALGFETGRDDIYCTVHYTGII